MDIKKFSNIDLYGLINVEFTATENDVRTFCLLASRKLN